MIKRLKKPCYIVICDNCGEDVFGYGYITHFETKQEALDAIESDHIEVDGKKHFCSIECFMEYHQKHEGERK